MKIITALNNEKINQELKKENKYEILNSDIQYQEGIFEIMEKIKFCDILIISEKIIGKIKFEELILKIKKNKKFKRIIVCLNKKNQEKEEKLKLIGITEIINKKITIEEIKNNINLNNEIIFENKIRKIINSKNKIKKYLIKIIKKIKNKKNIIINKKIINILGTPGSGKTIFLIILSLIIKNKKILIIDFYDNELINLINYKKIKKNNSIISVNKNLKILINAENIINENNIKIFLNNNKNKYDFIIFDSSKIEYKEINKIIIENSEINILLIEPNILELKKCRNLLNKYINIWKIKKDKINIIFNKVNINSIDNIILKNIFSDFKIIGNLKYNKNYNLIINSNLKIIPKKIKNQIKKILYKI